jgi:hypothetical protein
MRRAPRQLLMWIALAAVARREYTMRHMVSARLAVPEGQ